MALVMKPNAVTKLFLPARAQIGDTGILPLQPIDQAAWIWHPEPHGDEPVFLRFRRTFAARGKPLVIHVSADERYELFLDGKRISRGPDRCDVQRWSYATYRIRPAPGAHTLEALAWKVGPAHAPLAQISLRGGFILKAEDPYDADLTTGVAPWEVLRLRGFALQRPANWSVFGTGSEITIYGREFRPDLAGYVPPAVVHEALGKGNPWGCPRPGRMLFPSTLPERLDRDVAPGRAAAAGGRLLEPNQPVLDEETRSPTLAAWQALIAGRQPLTIPPNASAYLLWDLDDYFCGYPVLSVGGGAGARVTWGWEESLYAKPDAKGNRGEIAGKFALCRGDAFVADGSAARDFTTHWWRAGRYCLLNVRTEAEPLTIRRIAVNETRYPVEMQGSFEADDPELKPIVEMCVRGVQMCSHETFMDCPYYEQLMYVGDTRLEMLATCVLSRDERLVRRGIELFDRSRVHWGFVNERYPSRDPQQSNTFSLIWTLMLHDYAYWRNDPAWLRDRLIGLRSMLEHFQPYRNRDGLLEALPGWSFMDWVKEWDNGVTPGGRGVCGVINLLYALALQKAADLERLAGEPLLAQRHRQRAAAVARKVAAKFWDEKRGLMADTLDHEHFSEHAQSLALLTDAVTGRRARRVLQGLLTERLTPCSTYFNFYLFEALRKMGRGDVFVERLSLWKDMIRLGCKTPLESPEPSRSDCHAWGSHPLFHLYATVAGIRPASPGFRTVSIAPQLGPWKRVRCRLPHPDGEIALDIRKTRIGWEASASLPAGIRGTFKWGRRAFKLAGGRQTFSW